MRYGVILFIILFYSLFNANSGEISLYTQSKLSSLTRSIQKEYRDDYEQYTCYVHFSKISALSEIENLGLNTNSIIDDIAIIRIPQSLIETIANIDGIERIEMGTPTQSTLDEVRKCSGIDYAHNAYELPSAYTGKGVIVGIIDQGIQLDHLNFYDTNGNLRIKRYWNQTDTQGSPPEGFNYGSEYTTQSEIETIKYDTDNGTHAIHVAGIAVGGYKGCDFYGVATESDIVFVSYDGYTSSISDAIAYIKNYATTEGKPVVINMSIGGFIGPRDGTSDFDIIADNLQDNGCILVGAAGNGGDKISHVSKTLASNNDKLKTFMPCAYKLKNYTSQNIDYIEIYGSENTHMNLTLSLYNKQTNTYISQSSLVSTQFCNSTLYSLNNGIVGTVEVYSEIVPNTKRPHILIIKSLTQASNNYAIEMSIGGTKNNTIHAWSYMDTFDSYNVESYTSGDSDYSVNEVGGTGKRIITVGSYVTKNIFDGVVGDISSISSKGPTTDGRQKPNVTAPGEGIISSFSNSPNISQSSYYKPYLDFGTTVSKDNETYYYGAMSGTSMAAPVVTGIIAQWLQARPTLSPEDIKEIIAKTAITDEFTGDTSQQSNTWGCGKIDAWKGIKECLILNSIDGVEPISDKLVLIKNNISRGSINLLFAKEIKNATISVHDITGKILYSNNYTNIISGDEIILNISSCSKGVYIIKIVGEGIFKTFKTIAQ